MFIILFFDQVMDNLLIEVVGNKKVVLFDPKDSDFLYMNGRFICIAYIFDHIM